jgi:hypothetical protein
MGNEILEKILPCLPLVIAQETALWLAVAVLSILLINIFC